MLNLWTAWEWSASLIGKYRAFAWRMMWRGNSRGDEVAPSVFRVEMERMAVPRETEEARHELHARAQEIWLQAITIVLYGQTTKDQIPKSWCLLYTFAQSGSTATYIISISRIFNVNVIALIRFSLPYKYMPNFYTLWLSDLGIGKYIYWSWLCQMTCYPKVMNLIDVSKSQML